MRVRLLVAAVVLLLPAVASAQANACDRACLTATADQDLQALVAKDLYASASPRFVKGEGCREL